MKYLAAVLLLAGAGPLAVAAQTPAGAELEPAVNTSAQAPAAAVPVTPPVQPAAAAAKPSVAGAPVTAQGGDRAAARPAARSGKAMDRLELEATQITGNRELPKVMYVVPWRRADMGDLLGRPANSLLDEALAPVDRDVFRRQTQYYQALQPDQTGAAPATGKDEK